MLIKLLICLLPWPLRRLALERWFGFIIHPNAYIGFSWIFPRKLVMGDGARIDHFNVAIHLEYIELKERSSIGRGNWITGFPLNHGSSHFKHEHGRRPELLLRESAAITKNHHIDCTNLIEIGSFATVAGYQSQLLTHSIDIEENRQSSAPISIGAYAFVGTNVVVLGGAQLPAHSVLGAKSLLNKKYSEEWMLYGGVPARAVRNISPNAKYFIRTVGFVN